ncbi:Mitochondrial import receptor subunit TOM70 [Pleodorina starrii]|uniref:Mitochondrial import receptor subunit TOM70 n=1 Tax=Pleodorina starrii TaxID=330485 RepID=A0A9W6BC00_9CHLO|nr:Mitochondrial import receptor subunit TOM70 [Pleodorina starrii]GLC72607.1 Mitochondrial import receptor subunit TOM70 [Pleodorina starrii]
MDNFAACMVAQILRMSEGATGATSTSSGTTGRPQTSAERDAARKRIISSHNESLRTVTEMYGTTDMSVLHKSISGDVKSAADFPAPPPMESCTPISVSELRVGVTHRGRVLRGKLIARPVLMTGLSTLLEDENGDVVRLAVYNLIPALGGLAGMVAGAKALPEGRAVAVLEPFFKRMADGTTGVRVDNPLELVFLDSLDPADAASLQDDGRRHFQAAEYDAAETCYSRALLRMPDAGATGTDLLVIVLNNLSAALLNLGDAPAALHAAAAAAAVRPDGSKAHYRAAMAAARMGPGLALAARAELHRAAECMPDGGPGSDEWERMVADVGPIPRARTAPSAKQAAQGRVDLLRALSATPPEALLLLLQAPPAAAPPPAAAIAAAAAAKEAGNAAFKAARYDTARRQYLSALATLASALPAAALLANQAACHLQLAHRKRAVAAATAALVLEPRHAKAHHRRAQALLQLGWLAEAKAAADAGLAAVPSADADGRAAIATLKERIRTAAAAAPAAAAAAAADAGGRAAGATTERKLHELRSPVGAVEQTAFLNRMAEMADRFPHVAAKMEAMRREQPLMWRAMQKDARVPPFHEEFKKAARWPPGCDVSECIRRLWEAYELCVAMPMHLLAMSSAKGADPLEIQMKRAGTLDQQLGARRMLWLFEAPDGEVSFRVDIPGYNHINGSGYNPTIFHSFVNGPAPPMPMPPPPAPTLAGDGSSSGGGGSAAAAGQAAVRTHVAVGFVDLGTLTAAVNLPEWDEQVAAADRELAARRAASSGGGGGDAAASGAATHGSPGQADASGPVPAAQQRPAAPLLRWVGFEASPYSVAKTLVVERMLRMGGREAADVVLQVWYSSTWSREAHAAFRRALTDILKNATATDTEEDVFEEQRRPATAAAAAAAASVDTMQLPAAVLSYLRHWQLRDVSLAESRRRWMADWRRTLCVVGQFTQKADRLALSEYHLTGQLPGLGGGELEGSVVMFAKPKGTVAERSLDESFLESIPPLELLAARLQPTNGKDPAATNAPAAAAGQAGSSSSASGGGSGGGQGKKNKKKNARGGGGGGTATGSSASSAGGDGSTPVDIVAAGVELLRRRVQRLGSLLATGRVEVQVHLKLLEPGDFAAAASISALHPASISWSNVPDYYSPAAFHSLARACSAPLSRPPAAPKPTNSSSSSTAPATATAGSTAETAAVPTVHYVTSMNWTLDVKGASHIDYLLPYMMAGDEDDDEQDMPGKAVSDLILKLTEEGERVVRDQLVQYGKLGGSGGGGDGLLFDPPVDNPRNVVDYALTVRHYQAWVDAFLRAGRVRQQSQQATGSGSSGGGGGDRPRPQVVGPPVYAPLTRVNTTISLSYSYD